ncbi:YncE family protein [Caldithrix abyssi]
MKPILLIFIFSLFFLFSCEKDPTGTKEENTVQSVGAFIVNEGNFGKGNGSLSFYSYQDETIQNDIFKNINGRPLGDTPNSMTIYDSLGFIVVNNSNTIEVISLKTWKSKKTIVLEGGPSPRFLAIVSDDKAYVSNLYANNVAVIDLKTLTLTGATIAVGANPEEIAVAEGKAFVLNSGFGSANTVSVIDISQDRVVATLTVGDNPTSVALDDDGELNVLCTGRWPAWGDTTDTGTNGGVYVIDPSKLTVVDSVTIEGHPSKITYAGGDKAYFLLNGQVVQFSTAENNVINPSFIAGFFYGIEADPIAQLLFVLDAKDYQSNGELKIYDFNGTLQKSLTVGIIPGAVTFVYE